MKREEYKDKIFKVTGFGLQFFYLSNNGITFSI